MMRPSSAGSRRRPDSSSSRSGSPQRRDNNETIEYRARRRSNRRLARVISKGPESLTTTHHRGVRSPFAEDVWGQSSPPKGANQWSRKPRFKELTLVKGEDYILQRLQNISDKIDRYLPARDKKGTKNERDRPNTSTLKSSASDLSSGEYYKTWQGRIQMPEDVDTSTQVTSKKRGRPTSAPLNRQSEATFPSRTFPTRGNVAFADVGGTDDIEQQFSDSIMMSPVLTTKRNSSKRAETDYQTFYTSKEIEATSPSDHGDHTVFPSSSLFPRSVSQSNLNEETDYRGGQAYLAVLEVWNTIEHFRESNPNDSRMLTTGVREIGTSLSYLPSIQLPEWFQVFPSSDTTVQGLRKFLVRGLDPVLLADRQLSYYHRAASKVNNKLHAQASAWVLQLDVECKDFSGSSTRMTRAQRIAARESPSELVERLVKQENDANAVVSRNVKDSAEDEIKMSETSIPLRREYSANQMDAFTLFRNSAPVQRALTALASAVAIGFRLHRFIQSGEDFFMFTAAEFIKWLDRRGVVEPMPSGTVGSLVPERWQCALYGKQLPPVALNIVWKLPIDEAVCLSRAYALRGKGITAGEWSIALSDPSNYTPITQSAVNSLWSDTRRCGAMSDNSEVQMAFTRSPKIHREWRVINRVAELAIKWGLSGKKWYFLDATDAFDAFVREAEHRGSIVRRLGLPTINSVTLRDVWGVLTEDADTFIACYSERLEGETTATLNQSSFGDMWEEIKRAAVVYANKSISNMFASEIPAKSITSVGSHTATPSEIRAFWAVQLNGLLFSKVDESEGDRESMSQIDLEADIRDRFEFATSPKGASEPLFAPGVVTFSSALRFQGGRQAVEQAEESRFTQLCSAAFQNCLDRQSDAVQNPDFATSSETQLPGSSALNERIVQWPIARANVDISLQRWSSAPMSRGEVVSVHVGGAGCRLGASLWGELAVEPDETLWDAILASEDSPFPRALFIDTDHDAIDYHVLGSRSACRGLIDLDQTLVCKTWDDSTFTGASETFQRNGIAVENKLRRYTEQCDSLQGFMITHALGGGTGSGGGAWLADHLQECYGKKSSIAYQVASNPSTRSFLNGPINDLNEIVGLHKCQTFGMRVLLSNQAAHAHGNLCLPNHSDSASNGCFDDVNRLFGTAIAATTATLRRGSSELVPALKSLGTLAGICGHFNQHSSGMPSLPNITCLAHTQRAPRERIWSASVAYAKHAQLSPFGLESVDGYRIRSALLLTGPTKIPASAFLSRGSIRTATKLCEELTKTKKLLAGTTTAGSGPSACAIVNTTAAKSFLWGKVKAFRKHSRHGNPNSCHFISNSFNESDFSEAEQYLTGLVKQYRQIERFVEGGESRWTQGGDQKGVAETPGEAMKSPTFLTAYGGDETDSERSTTSELKVRRSDTAAPSSSGPGVLTQGSMTGSLNEEASTAASRSNF